MHGALRNLIKVTAYPCYLEYDLAFMEPMVKELLADGADPTARAKNGDTALTASRRYQCPACTKRLEEAIAKKLGTAVQSER